MKKSSVTISKSYTIYFDNIEYFPESEQFGILVPSHYIADAKMKNQDTEITLEIFELWDDSNVWGEEMRIAYYHNQDYFVLVHQP